MPRRSYYVSIPITHTFTLSGANSFEGTTYSSFTCSFDGTSVSLSSCTWSVSGSNYVSISNGILSISQGANADSITITATYNYQGTNYSATHSMTVTYPSVQHSLTIVGPENPDIIGETVQLSALFDGMALPSGASPTWEFRNYQGGNDTIDNSGLITIDQSNPETHPLNVWCIYNGYEAEININVLYQSGASSTTTTETIIDAQTGETTTTTTTFVDNGDGTSTSTTNITTTDSNGDITGTSRSETETQSDGSSTTTTTNYDANGNATDRTNQDRDSSGNVDTQNIVYDANGNATVTGYTIDTSDNPNGTKDITGDGVNTEFVPFDGSEGFELHIRFKSRKQDQPNPPLVVDTEDTSSNYHFTILCSKDPNAPYPGFHIRWSLSKTNYNSGNIVFGYRGKTGSATNRNLALAPSTGDHANTYDYTISYDPTLKKYPSKFRLEDNLNGSALITLNIDFNPLAYALTLGYNINKQGQPYRYSNVEILEFSINKL